MKNYLIIKCRTPINGTVLVIPNQILKVDANQWLGIIVLMVLLSKISSVTRLNVFQVDSQPHFKVMDKIL